MEFVRDQINKADVEHGGASGAIMRDSVIVVTVSHKLTAYF